MLLVIGIFLISQIVYHIIVTFFGYGTHLIDQSYLAMIRDGLRILICGVYFLLNIKYWKGYLELYWKIFSIFVVLILFGCLISYFFFDKSFNDLLIGIKYGLRWMLILFFSLGIGYFFSRRLKQWTNDSDGIDGKDMKGEYRKLYNKIFKYLKWSLIGIVIIGWVWQIVKLIYPNMFFSLGYGKLDDFHYGDNPPIYYLTGYEGTLRWQGLFSGPNNYGYFLVAFLPLVLWFFPFGRFKEIGDWGKKDWLNLAVCLLWCLTIVATLSRTAILGGIFVIFLMNWSWFYKHKKYGYLLGILILLSIGILSVLKWDSTIQHLYSKFDGVRQVIDAPLGYGLGSSGPAVHHSGNFLPENYYLQLMLDLGTVGFIIWCCVMIFFFFQEKKILKEMSNSQEDYNLLGVATAMQKGFLALLLMGVFLHVFEDSMVNYLFFIIYGIILGSCSVLVDGGDIIHEEKDSV